MQKSSFARIPALGTLLILLLVGIGLAACSPDAGDSDPAMNEEAVEQDESAQPAPGQDESGLQEDDDSLGAEDASMKKPNEPMSPERASTVMAWAATQDANSGGVISDMLGDMSGQPVESTPDAPAAFAPGGESSSETPYDGMAIEAATGLFSTSIGRANVDVQNLSLHVLSVAQLARLRGMPPMPLGTRGANSNIWVVVFDTAEPLTAGGFLPENIDELPGLSADSALAGPDGLTTVYYILSLSDDQSSGRFTGIGKGILNERTLWSRADLEAMDAEE